MIDDFNSSDFNNMIIGLRSFDVDDNVPVFRLHRAISSIVGQWEIKSPVAYAIPKASDEWYLSFEVLMVLSSWQDQGPVARSWA